jgi:hypothetical protein
VAQARRAPGESAILRNSAQFWRNSAQFF